MIGFRTGAIAWASMILLAYACGTPGERPMRLNHPLPFGAVDPIPPVSANGTLRLTGWVLSRDPVAIVSLYLDGRYVTTAELHQPRPDVSRAYPEWAHVHAGWKFDLDAGLFPGEHEAVIQARTLNGTVRDLTAAPLRIVNR